MIMMKIVIPQQLMKHSGEGAMKTPDCPSLLLRKLPKRSMQYSCVGEIKDRNDRTEAGHGHG